LLNIRNLPFLPQISKTNNLGTMTSLRPRCAPARWFSFYNSSPHLPFFPPSPPPPGIFTPRYLSAPGLHVATHPNTLYLTSRPRNSALSIASPRAGLALFTTTLFCSQNTVQLMTAGMFHVTNLTHRGVMTTLVGTAECNNPTCSSPSACPAAPAGAAAAASPTGPRSRPTRTTASPPRCGSSAWT
jgi:hypothetical protein